MISQFFMPVALAAALLGAGGCAGYQLRGLSPSVRTFADEPTSKDYYVGMDLRFAVLEPADERRIAEATKAKAKLTGLRPAEAEEAVIVEDELADVSPDLPDPVPPPAIP